MQQAFECVFYQESYNLTDTGATRAAEKFDASTTEPGGWGQEEVCRQAHLSAPQWHNTVGAHGSPVQMSLSELDWMEPQGI